MADIINGLLINSIQIHRWWSFNCSARDQSSSSNCNQLQSLSIEFILPSCFCFRIKYLHCKSSIFSPRLQNKRKTCSVGNRNKLCDPQITNRLRRRMSLKDSHSVQWYTFTWNGIISYKSNTHKCDSIRTDRVGAHMIDEPRQILQQ